MVNVPKVCGVLTNDHSGLLAWSFDLYLDGKLVDMGGVYQTKFMAKWALRRAVRGFSSTPYTYCKPALPKDKYVSF